MQSSSEGIKAGETQFAADHRFVRERAADATIFFRDRRTKQPGRTGLVPDFALVHALLIPAIEMRHVLGRDEPSRLILEQHKVLSHPTRPGKVEDVHDRPFGSRNLPNWDTQGGGRRALTTL